jgi:hypothetical protein
MIRKREAPSLYSGNVPESQDHAHQLVGHALDNLNHYLQDFASALELFDHAYELMKTAEQEDWDVFRHWQFVAARDGALSIYHFQWSLQGMFNSLAQCPYLASRLDEVALRQAKKQFDKWFANAVAMRNSVGHAGDKTKHAQEHLQHAFTGICDIPGLRLGLVTNYTITDHLCGRMYCNTWNKKIECYRIDHDNLQKMTLTRDTIFDIFDAMNAKFKGS